MINSAAHNIGKRTERLLALMAGLVVLSGLVSFSLLYLAQQRIAILTNLQQERLVLDVSSEQNQALIGFVQTESATLSELETLFPTEVQLESTYSQLLTLLRQIDPLAVLQFESQSPVTDTAIAGLPPQKHLKMSIRLTATIEQVQDLLRQLERQPFVIQVINLESDNPRSITALSRIQIKLFVADAFTQP